MKKCCQVFLILLLAVYPLLSLAVEPLPGSAGQQEILLPGDTADETYGVAGGYAHPYLSLSGEYTDNLFNVFEDEKTNWLSRISPGIWLAFPRTKEVPITIISQNTSAGGLRHELEQYARDDFNRFNAYLLGALDFEYYSENSELDTTNGRLEGLFRYNLKNGLSLQVLDQYKRDNDRFDIGAVARQSQRKYYSNLLELSADWEFSERIRVKANYNNFNLDYDEEVDAWLDRDDNLIGLYGFLNYSEKSSFFLNYDFIDVTYDTDINQKNNQQNFFYVGWEYATTEKTDFLVKFGYQTKEYDSNSVFTDNPDNFAFEFQGEHDFTEKTKLTTIASYKMEETDSIVATGKTVFAFWFRLSHDFSERIAGLLDFRYENADYDQIIDVERVDDRFYIRPAIQYVFNDWFMGELAYSYDTRESTQDLFDYDTNTFYLFLNFAR